MIKLRALAIALAAALLAVPAEAQQTTGTAPPERQTSEDGRLQAVDAAGNPLFDDGGNPIWEASPEEKAHLLFSDAMKASTGLAPSSTAWQYSVIPPLLQALELLPDFKEARYDLGVIYLQTNDLDGAIQELEKVVKAGKEETRARVALGVAYERAGRLADAEMLYARGLAEDAGDVDLLCGQARLLLKRGRPEDAERAAKAILRINSNSIDAFNTLGLAYLEMRRFETARFVFQKARTLPGGDKSATLEANLGLVYWRMGREFQAEASFTEALRLDPNHAGARVNLAHLRLVNLDFQGARDLLEPAYQQLKGNQVVQLSFAVAMRGTGDYDRARQIYEELAADPTSDLRDDALLNLGIMEGDFLKDFAGAIDTYNEYIAVRDTMGQPVGPDEPVRAYLREVEKLKERRDRKKEQPATAPAPAPTPAPDAPPDEEPLPEPAGGPAAPDGGTP